MSGRQATAVNRSPSFSFPNCSAFGATHFLVGIIVPNQILLQIFPMSTYQISSPQNSQIKDARKLMQRRHRHESGRLLIEGLRLIGDAWRSGVRPLQIFYDGDVRNQNSDIDHLLNQMEQANILTLACTSPVFHSLTDTVSPQGIAAVTAIPLLPLPSAPSLILMLDNVRDPGNAGTLLRSAEAAGVDLVIFAPGSVDAFNEKVMRAGMGAHFRLPLRLCDSWADVYALQPATLPIYCADANAAQAYDQIDWCQPTCLVVGNEANGVSEEIRQRSRPIMIPMQGNTESLNAAMAGSIILFEAARQRRNCRATRI